MKEPIQEPGHTVSGSSLNVKEARERCEAATEGPWEMFEAKDSPPIVRKVNGQRFVCEVRGSWQTMLTKDAEFIAHARSDLPAALEALEEAQGKLDAVEEAWEFVHLAILDSDTHPRHGYGDCDSCDAVWDMLIVVEHCILRGTKEGE